MSLEEKLRQRYIENFMFIKQANPALFELINQKEDINWRITTTDGYINLLIDNKPVYNKDPYKIVDEQIESIDFSRPSIAINLDISENLLKKLYITGKGLGNTLQKTLLSTKELKIPYREVIPSLIVVGLGLGIHIEKLIDKFNILNLTVIELSPELVKPSIAILDWKKILSYFSKPHRKFQIIISKDPEALKESLFSYFENVGLIFLAISVIYKHINSEILNKAISLVAKDFSVYVSRTLFFEDQLLALKNTYINTKKKVKIFRKSAEDKFLNKDIPIFIVGSGPSLDSSIDALKKNRDKALIVSCGTALRALLSYDIIPDIHFEAEFREITYKHLKEIEKNVLRKIPFIGFHFVFPHIPDLFKKSILALIHGSVSTEVLEDNDLLNVKITGPTVTATSMSLFTKLGFRKFFLFGVDLGTYDPSLHHSQKTAFYDNKSVLKGLGEYRFNYKVEGYEGPAFTSFELFVTKYVIEKLIELYGLKVFNVIGCVKIDKAERIKPEDLSDILEAPINKRSIENVIFSLGKPVKRLKIPAEKFVELMQAFFKDFSYQLETLKNKDSFISFFNFISGTYELLSRYPYIRKLFLSSIDLITNVFVLGVLSGKYNKLDIYDTLLNFLYFGLKETEKELKNL